MAKAGSFTRAGEKLALNQSSISRSISSLERDLNVPLFQRHARGLMWAAFRPLRPLPSTADEPRRLVITGTDLGYEG